MLLGLIAMVGAELSLNPLNDLYISTHGDYWRYYYGLPWNFSTNNPNPCAQNWQGVVCSGNCTNFLDKTCHIIQLNLIYTNMTGPIPPSISNLTNLLQLNFNSNNLNGQLPPQISNLHNLINFSIALNFFTGNFPIGFGSMQLKMLYINNNLFSGLFPHDWIHLNATLQVLNINNNRFEGYIPDTISYFSHLITFRASNNLFIGSISSSIGNLTSLNTLILSHNQFTGPIPNNTCVLTQLRNLDLSSNHLTNIIPTCIVETQINTLLLNTNYLTGSIPDNIGNLSQLLQLYIFDNYITNSIPSSTGLFQQIYSLQLQQNYLTGSIPNELKSCFFFNAENNIITGIIPNGFETYSMSLTNNFISNSLPSSLSQAGTLFFANNLLEHVNILFNSINNIYYFDVSINKINDPLPEYINNSKLLYSFNISYNHIIGTIPSQFALCYYLEFLDISHNSITGIFNYNIFEQLLLLNALLVQDNQLTGSITDFYLNTDNVTSLTNVDLSNNKFTGALPIGPFYSPRLVSFAAVGNCLHGTIPIIICNCTSLNVLALDGLHAGKSCQMPFFPSIHTLNSYSIIQSITGTIPNCLFNMPSIQTLHLSGNALIGTLSNDIIISHSLINLLLSNNQLTGTIPYAFQYHTWNILDLSFNKFSGHIETNNKFYGDNNNQTTLSLQVNRLSGIIPNNLLKVSNINILN
eukprot:gene10943-14693_t